MNIELQDIIVFVIVIACVAVAVVRTFRFCRKSDGDSPCCGCGSSCCKAKGKIDEELPECCSGEKTGNKKTPQ
jgi:hypothetical protein